MDKVLEKAARVTLAVFDVDGVMTRGDIILAADGSELKIFHVHDGTGLVMLKRTGCTIAVISARSSEVVTRRMSELGIELVYQKQNDKKSCLEGLARGLDINRNEIMYVGDDLVDIPAMQMAGLAVAVDNAHPLVKQQADWVTTKPGGGGAVREVCELLLSARGLLDQAYNEFLG